jgi:hypothetical protein
MLPHVTSTQLLPPKQAGIEPAACCLAPAPPHSTPLLHNQHQQCACRCCLGPISGRRTPCGTSVAFTCAAHTTVEARACCVSAHSLTAVRWPLPLQTQELQGDLAMQQLPATACLQRPPKSTRNLYQAPKQQKPKQREAACCKHTTPPDTHMAAHYYNDYQPCLCAESRLLNMEIFHCGRGCRRR